MSAKNDHIVLDAKIVAVVNHGVFKAKLSNEHEFIAVGKQKGSGTVLKGEIGTQMKVEFSTYDMSKGRIVGE